MTEGKRLELIVEAVRYCQRVSDLGMPPRAYTKALREAVHFLWERRFGKQKDHCARLRSKASLGVRRGSGELHYDHAIPFRYLEKELLALKDVTPDAVRVLLDRHSVVVLVTKREHSRLKNEMPDGGFKARFEAAHIELVPNPLYSAQE